MRSSKLDPEKLAEAAAMREAGFSLATISSRCGASIRTLQREFHAYKVIPGAAKAALVEKAREELVGTVLGHEKLTIYVARLIHDDVANVMRIRDRVAEGIEALEFGTHQQALEASRALAALSTSLRVTHEVLRGSLRMDAIQSDLDVADLPMLTIRGMTPNEFDAIRARAEAPDEELAD